MGEVVKFKKPRARDKNKGRTLCASGFHKWQIVISCKFDVKQGKLVSLMRCARCGKEQNKLT